MDLESKTVEELTDRAWELYDHQRRLFSNEQYRLDVINGVAENDPLADPDYDPDDPWFSLTLLEDYLSVRGDN